MAVAKTFLTDNPNAAWAAEVPEISTEDPVLGGPGEVVNAPHQALVDRTNNLRRTKAEKGDLTAHTEARDAHGATSEVPAAPAPKDTIVRRDTAGKAQVATPVSTDPNTTVTNVDYVVTKVTEVLAAAGADLLTHVNARAAHEASSAVPASGGKDTIIRRDANGRAQVAEPSADADIAVKKTVDTHAALTSPHSATSAATASRLVVRDGNAKAQVETPASNDPSLTIANKGYVDTEVGKKAATAHAHSGADITSGTVNAAYLPTATDAEAKAQTLTTKVVTPKNLDGFSKTDHTHSAYAAASHAHSGADITSGTVNAAYLPTATDAEAKAQTLTTRVVTPKNLDGFSKTDHTHSTYSPTSHDHSGTYAPVSHMHTSAQISDATNLDTASMVVRRDANKKAQVATPISTDPGTTIATKDYVDKATPSITYASQGETEARTITNKCVNPGGLANFALKSEIPTPALIVYATPQQAQDMTATDVIISPARLADASSSAATANRLIRRDGNAKAQVATPETGDPPLTIANMQYVDVHINATANVHGATSAATPNRLVIRDDNGKAQVVTPTSADDIKTIANREYVDTGLGSHTHSAYAATGHNHDGTYALDPHTHSGYAPTSHQHGGADITGGTVNAAYLPTATTAAKGAVQLATLQETIGGTWVDKSSAFTSGATVGTYYRNSHASSTLNILGVQTAPGDAVLAVSSSSGIAVDLTPANPLVETKAVTPKGVYAATSDLIANIAVI